ncbi:MAG TPA: hypothetical protein VGF75_02805 [Candidatus Saccharimonadales bacterium]
MEDKIPVNLLTKAQEERLIYLIEEGSEVIKAATKILRHGYRATNPLDQDHKGNKHDLESELADFSFAVRLLMKSKDVDANKIDLLALGREENPPKYFHYQGFKDAG